ncbi:MAG: (2Fe-2S)-binding protein [Devosia sp.]
MSITLTINGAEETVNASPQTPLLWVIRDHLRMTGTKFGCGVAQCGACTVLWNGQPTRSCALPLSVAANGEVTTIESLDGAEAEAVKAAWVALDVPQCGYCQSGQVVAATALLRDNKAPTDDDIDRAMSGNLCRCATYGRIRQAIHDAAETLEG